MAGNIAVKEENRYVDSLEAAAKFTFRPDLTAKALMTPPFDYVLTIKGAVSFTASVNGRKLVQEPRQSDAFFGLGYTGRRGTSTIII